MVRAAATLLAVILLLAPTLAADPPESAGLALQKAYTDRLLSMADTAPAHVELAKWCASAGLADRAQVHWKEALARDADNPEARAALGFVRKGEEWVAASEAPPPAARSTPAMSRTGTVAATSAPEAPGLLVRRAEFRRVVQEIARDQLPSTDFYAREAGRAAILGMTDPAAAEPIATILAKGGVEARKLACEALGRMPGDEAGRLLTGYSLRDRSEEVRAAAVAALKDREQDRTVPRLLAALKSGGKARERAAFALAELGDRRAVPALIGRLNTTEHRIYEAPAANSRPYFGTGVYIAIGQVTTYIQDLEPVVAEAAVGWKPTVGAVLTGGVLDVRNVSVTIYRTIVNIRVPQPAVREALMRLTGEDFGYDEAQWQTWLQRSAGELSSDSR